MNPLQANLHTHADFCDGKKPLEEMIQAAVDLNYLALGFSSHSPLPFSNTYAMTPRREGEYLDAMEAMKEKYRDELELLIGLEWDLDTPAGFVPFERYDFIIGSVHQLHVNGKMYAVDESREGFARLVHEGFDGDGLATAKAYYDAMIKNALRPQVDIVGHFDLLRKFNERNVFFDEDSDAYRTIARDALLAIAEARKDLVFEVNFGGMKRAGLPTPYPDRFLMEHLCRLDARITLQADAHEPNALGAGWDDVIHYAKDSGFRYAYRYRQDAIWERIQL